MSQETKLDCRWMTSPCCCSYMIQTYTQRWGFFLLPLGCLFEQIATQNKKMTWHEKQSETKQSKNKTLDVPVNIGVTLCQQRPSRSLLTEHPKWGKDINLLTWKSGSTEADLGMNSQYVFFCVCERRRACEEVCPPWSAECVEALSLRLRLALARGLKSRGGRVDASLSSEGCFKLHCTHSVDIGSLVHWY